MLREQPFPERQRGCRGRAGSSVGAVAWSWVPGEGSASGPLPTRRGHDSVDPGRVRGDAGVDGGLLVVAADAGAGRDHPLGHPTADQGAAGVSLQDQGSSAPTRGCCPVSHHDPGAGGPRLSQGSVGDRASAPECSQPQVSPAGAVGWGWSHPPSPALAPLLAPLIAQTPGSAGTWWGRQGGWQGGPGCPSRPTGGYPREHWAMPAASSLSPGSQELHWARSPHHPGDAAPSQPPAPHPRLLQTAGILPTAPPTPRPPRGFPSPARGSGRGSVSGRGGGGRPGPSGTLQVSFLRESVHIIFSVMVRSWRVRWLQTSRLITGRSTS